ncbi:ATP-dependent RecD-like DNA helicase [Crassaminicella thermophila]|uniref:ATP-dependent RecD2 DNA helicase n=1 Tax=Crassaminicella thermophila TaxID=2599308 RepID=A0A5C0SBL0_CRATE|nr:ATP-dependent RecD-like DNA helicase [Crassaminicella thermophila]QEK11302.1 ATP-dependent RecD-like DNA helicase [Crassaminicella thermophila]
MSVEIKGVLSEIIFKNDSNGYTVATVETEDEVVTVVGYMPILNTGETFAFSGKWIVHPTYGEQLEVASYRQVMPNTLEGIEKYLSSGIIKGIGPKLAKKIVESFGKETLDIMQYRPHLLTQVNGIGESKARKIVEAFKEQRELSEVMLFLGEYGISPNYAIKIYKQYKDKTIQFIQENPYRLADDIFGIGFKIADAIAKRMGIDPRSPYRVMCGTKYLLTQYNLEGHTYTPREELIKQTAKILDVGEELVEDALVKLALNNEIHLENLEGEIVVFAMPYFYAESYVCKKLIEMAQVSLKPLSEDLDKEIQEIEEIEEIVLANNQRQAIKEAANNGVLVITGGPGTGKTTTINSIIKMFENHNLSIALAAPTGRAAKRMSEATGKEAKTIHRLLEYAYIEEAGMDFGKNEEDPLPSDVVIIDEMSMVDIRLMKGLMKALLPGTRLILVGDVDQLPSVGAGNVLRDIIDSNVIKVVKLDKIFRQAQESMIIVNAHRINKGEYPYINKKEKDFYFIKKKNQEHIVQTIKELCKERLPNFSDCDPIKSIQVLTPIKKGQAGMYQLNNHLQAILNPPSPYKQEKEMKDKIFRVGDKVMQMKNNYNLKWKTIDEEDEGEGIFNGDLGYIYKIDHEEKEMIVQFDEDKLVTYDFSQLDELELAYCITIHKSQGSEFPIVVMPIFWGPPMLLTRNLLYTAVTRAKELVVMVGLEASLKSMVDNHRIIQRNSGLGIRLKRFLDENLLEF